MKNKYFVLLALGFLSIFFNPSLDVLASSSSDNIISLEIFGLSFGEVDLSQYSLPVITFLVAFIDGFNPCAMWVLLFLISLLLEVEDKFKKWTLGLVFLITSGISYFFFLAAWLEINELIGLIPWTRGLIALFAWGAGIWSIKSYLDEKDKESGCKVAGNEDRQKMFAKLKKIVLEQSFILSIIGIILLALSVNLFELLCSAALPATYTNVLASQDVTGLAKYAYLLFYVLVFMIDDIIIFAVAMITMQVTGISTKYNRLSKLIGGIVMMLLATWITIEVMQGLGLL
jgi:hypothetical protein